MSKLRLASPYLEDKHAVWLRGNLHTHTTRSDGRSDPQEMIAAYADLGYDFLMLSDHDVLGSADGLDGRGMVILRGNEISGNGPHLLDVAATKRVEPHFDRQRVINSIAEEGGLAVLCHPNWTENFNHYTYEAMMGLSGYSGLEIFNGVVVDLPGSHLAVDKWDRLLAAGRTIWGFANDDAHGRDQTARGWNVVRAKDRTAGAILEAFRAGSFYASSGVEIETVATNGPELHVLAPNADVISVFSLFGARIFSSKGPELRFDASALMTPYIRFECYGRGGATAWSQPITLSGGKYENLQKRFAELNLLERPVLHALHADGEVKLTGGIDDPLWRKAEVSSNFLRLKDGEMPEVKTEVRAIASPTKIVFAVRCEEPKPEAMKLTVAEDNVPGIWTDDSVELFLDVKGAATEYAQVIVNAAGYVFATMSPSGHVITQHVKAKAGRGESGWSVEVEIPLKALGASARRGSRWGFHVCRNRTSISASYVWSWVGPSNHNPSRFGSLVF